MRPNLHTLLIALAMRAVGLLPQRARGALDAWSQRLAHRRALRRQRRFHPKD